jgi:hypothetical protein
MWNATVHQHSATNFLLISYYYKNYRWQT